MIGATTTVVVFWVVQASALLAVVVPFSWAYLGLWALSHFVRAIGLTLAFHRYFAHRSFQMNRMARFVWAFIATNNSPGARAHYERRRQAHGDRHAAALRNLFNRFLGCLHQCLTTRQTYNEAKAFPTPIEASA